MSMKIYTDPKWIGKNIKTIVVLAGFLWGIFAYTMGWFNGVNAAVTDMPKVKASIIELGNKHSGLEGKVDTMIKLQTFQVLGQRKEAEALSRELQHQNP